MKNPFEQLVEKPILEENERLVEFKDEDGKFMNPARNFNNIDGWNPQEGYWVKVRRANNLTIKDGGQKASLFELGKDFPDHCADIFAVCEVE